jgi:hypothetical protein
MKIFRQFGIRLDGQRARLIPLLLVLLWSPALGAQTLALSPQNWNQQVTPPAGISASQTAQFSETGKEISIGPWTAGMGKARLECKESFPPKEGSLHGSFRTENLYPREAVVWITYKRGKKQISELTFWLGVSDDWESFNFPIVKPPAGCDAIVVSFGFPVKTHGRVHLTDLQIEEPIQLPDLPAEKSPLTRAGPPQPFKPAQFVRLERSGDTWWLVDTNGKPFFSLGCAMYGNKMKPEDSYPLLHNLGFNTIANGSDEKAWSAFNDQQLADHAPVMFQFDRVNSGIGLGYDTLDDAAGNNGMSQAQAAKNGGFNHTYPDPFDPRWEASARQLVHETAQLFKGKPYFVGWMVSNERDHFNLYRYVWSPHCAIQFGIFLEHKCGEIGALNKAWNSNYSSFDDLLAHKPEPPVIEGAMYEDFHLFSREIIRKFNDTMLRIIHEEDPGRLVFSNRFMIHEVRDVFDYLDLYGGFDGTAVNIYPSNDTWGLDPGEREYLTLIHEKNGKPIIITEWSVPARDSGLYDDPAHLDWSFPQTVATQQQRARQSAAILAEFYNMPFVVGAHWFSWSDFDSQQRQANRGLFKANNQPWPELQEAFKDLTALMGDPAKGKDLPRQ